MHHQLIRRFTSIVGPTQSVSTIKKKVIDMVSERLYDQTLEFYKEQVHLHPFALQSTAATSVLPSLIKACSLASAHSHYYFALQLHCVAIKAGSDSDPVASNSLISMYGKFSSIESARQMFDTMPIRDTVSWNSIINCYTQNGYFVEATEMFMEMYLCGFVPKPELVASIIPVLGRTGNSRLGRQIHSLVIVDERIKESVFLSTALVDMYLKCHNSLMALRVFDQMGVKNEVSWTAMVSGCTANQNPEMAIDCFRAMQVEGIKPNRVTLVTVLPACAELGYIEHGKEVQGYAFRHGFHSDSHFSAALINLYCKSGLALSSARLIFERSTVKDVVVWSSIIGSYSRSGDVAETMKLFGQMRVAGIQPNSVTLLAIISACTTLSSVNYGRGVFACILKSGLHFDIYVGNALINMFSKCGCLMDSHQIFKEMSTKDSISWSTLINGFGLHGCGEEALQLFHEMQEREIALDAITYLAVLSACSHAGFVKEGQRIFNDMVKDNRIPLTIEHYACYIDLLGRSGKLEDACEIVRKMPLKPSSKIWSSLVSACKVYGRLELAEMLAHQLFKTEPGNAANYTLLSMVCAESCNWLGVEEVRRVMRLKGLKKCYGFSQIELDNGSL